MFIDERSACASSRVASRFTNTPATATATIVQPPGAPGVTRRRIAPKTINPASTSSVPPLAWAERISIRRRPKVTFPCAGRRTRRITTTESSSAPASVSMCAASERSASEPARMPATISTTMKPTMSASPIVRRRVSVSSPIACACPACPGYGLRPQPEGTRRDGLSARRRRPESRVGADLAAGRAEEPAAERERARRAAGRARRGRRTRGPAAYILDFVLGVLVIVMRVVVIVV